MCALAPRQGQTLCTGHVGKSEIVKAFTTIKLAPWQSAQLQPPLTNTNLFLLTYP